MLEEPRSGRMAAWGNALFAGEVSPDEAAEHIVGEDSPHRVVGLPEGDGSDGRPVGLTLTLGRLRALGARALKVALPVPGHPLGLSGPPEFNSLALEAGEAVLACGAGYGFVPELDAAGPEGERSHPDDLHLEVRWRAMPVREAPAADVPSLGEAERELAEAMREATAVLTQLDVAGSGPVAQAALDAYRGRMEAGRRLLAPGYPPRAVRVLELAQRVGTLVGIARGETDGGWEHGAAVSGSQIAVRAEALLSVERTARRAQVAAYNAYAEERERGRS